MMTVLRSALFGTLLVLLPQCSLKPSTSPLGGTYSPPESLPAKDHQAIASAEPSSEPPSPASEPVVATTADAGTLPVATVVSPAPAQDELHYQPLKAGDRVSIEFSLGLSAAATGEAAKAMGASPTIKLDATAHVDLKIIRASLQSLDELELTFTPESIHGSMGNTVLDEAKGKPKIYGVTLTGNGAGVSKRGGGADSDPMQLALVTWLVVPLAEFHRHWAGTPQLDLRPGWSSTVAIGLPSFISKNQASLNVGPLDVRYLGREPLSGPAPFALSLPFAYDFGAGKVRMDLAGTAQLSAHHARPTVVDLAGPLNGEGAFGGTRVNLRGTAKIGAKLSYP